MTEQRLIDANKLNRKKKYLFETSGPPFPESEWFIKADDLFSAPTINPETLPIVRQLRAELARVTAERDAAVSDIETAMAYPNDNCRFCKNANCQSRNGTKPCLPKWRGPQKKG